MRRRAGNSGKIKGERETAQKYKKFFDADLRILETIVLDCSTEN
jgi:hypothetical protein